MIIHDNTTYGGLQLIGDYDNAIADYGDYIYYEKQSNIVTIW